MKVNTRLVGRLALAILLIGFSLITLIFDLSFVPRWFEIWPAFTLGAGIIILARQLPKKLQQ